MQIKPGRLISLLTAVLFLLVSPARPARADAGSDAPPLNEAETWVAEQVGSGEIADLSLQFPADPAKRVLRARFFRDLLTGNLPAEKIHSRAVRIFGAVFNEALVFDDEVVVRSLVLMNCHFTQRASFLRTVFSDSAGFHDCDFASDANFYGLKAKADFFLVDSTFGGKVSFGTANFAGSFYAYDTKFLSHDHPVDFLGMKVAANTSFDHDLFAGPVNFGNVEIGSNFTANGARFHDRKAGVGFLYMKVKASAHFKHATFAGPAMFGGLDVGELLTLDETRFLNKDVTVSFVNVKAGTNFSLSNALFDGQVEFVSAKVGAFLLVSQTQFRNPDKPARFLNVKVAEIAYFADTSFAGPLNLAEANFQSLFIIQTRSNEAPIPVVDLEGTSIKHELGLQRLHIRDFKAATLRVEGQTTFEEMQIDHLADLSYADFVTLSLTGSRWPSPKTGELLLRGMSYRSIGAGKTERDSHEQLIRMADQATYTADVYSNLETAFVHQGCTDDANDVYIAGKCRERRDNMTWRSPGFYWSWMLQGIGYGRYPERALYVCALVVALGCWIFKPAKMERQETGSFPHPRHYSRFWYSLELFLPIVELKAVDAWEPKESYRFLRHYMRVHVLLGWILVPIALAAQAGLIK